MKVVDAIGAQLDWMVAKCEGYECEFDDEVSGPWLVPQEGYLHDEKPLASFHPSTNWAQGGPILQAEKISVQVDHSGVWLAANYYTYDETTVSMTGGSTMLEAGMRCIVMSKLGKEIEIPQELLRNKP